MNLSDKNRNRVLTSRSNSSTLDNMTGSWRLLMPEYAEKTSPCSTFCPAGEDIARVEMLVSKGAFEKAWRLILKENPFPSTCGRICFHPCEEACNRKQLDDGILIHSIERFSGDNAFLYNFDPEFKKIAKRAEKVAIIGAGPFGLSAAYFISLLGYTCNVYEAMPVPGGILRWALPEFRLPSDILEKEIANMQKTGFSIHCSQKILQEDLDNIMEENDAVFFGCGNFLSSKLSIEGEDLYGVLDGLTFLKDVKDGKINSICGNVIIIGGGNTAVDTARSVVRLGGTSLIVYRRNREDMPAFEEEVTAAVYEGVKIKTLRSPVLIEKNSDGLTVTFDKMKMAEGSGREIIKDSGVEKIFALMVITAVGQKPEMNWYLPDKYFGRIISQKNSVIVLDKKKPPLFFGGDLTNDFKTVTHAVASGKEAAISMDILFKKGADKIGSTLADSFIGKSSVLSFDSYSRGPRSKRSRHVVGFDEINTDYFEYTKKIKLPELLRHERVKSFMEIDLNLSGSLAEKESSRCFNCGICNQCDNCRIYCPEMAVKLDNNIRSIDYNYCKGCGICVVECPVNAMTLKKEHN